VSDRAWAWVILVMAAAVAGNIAVHRRRRVRHAREKALADSVLAELATAIGGATYHPAGQSPHSLAASPDLGAVSGRFEGLAYVIRCFPRNVEDCGGTLSCRVTPPDGLAFDLPSRPATSKPGATGPAASLDLIFGRRTATSIKAPARAPLLEAARACTTMSLTPEAILAQTPTQVFAWPDDPDAIAAATWIRRLLTDLSHLPRRPA
jgi:hypothetical protein